jgi:hypothetical protein
MNETRGILDRGVAGFNPETDGGLLQTMRRVRQRRHQRRLGAGLVGGVAFLATGSLLWRAFLPPDPVEPGQPIPSATGSLMSPSDGMASPSANPSYCEGGPWSECSTEAVWVQEVIAQAGFTILRATGSAFVVEAEGKSFYMSAIAVSRQDHPGVESLQEAVQNGAYQLYAEIDGIPIYTDGIRYVWITQALQVHVQGGPPTDPLPSDAVLGTVVRLTQAIPYSETTP